MELIRRIVAPLMLFLVMVGMMVLGFATSQTGFVAVALLCLWPLLWAMAAWTIRGLRDTYQFVPKNQMKRRPTEVLN